MLKQQGYASYADLVKETGKPKYHISRWLRPALEMGLVDNLSGDEKGVPAKLKLGHFRPGSGVVLPPAAVLAERLSLPLDWMSPISGQRRSDV